MALALCTTVISLNLIIRYMSLSCLRCQDKKLLALALRTLGNSVILGQWNIKDRLVWLCLICVDLEIEAGPSDLRVQASEDRSSLLSVSSLYLPCYLNNFSSLSPSVRFSCFVSYKVHLTTATKIEWKERNICFCY